MAAGNHKLSMDEYKQLSELLRKAESDGRLGEAMVFSGLADKVEPARPVINTHLVEHLAGTVALLHLTWRVWWEVAQMNLPVGSQFRHRNQ